MGQLGGMSLLVAEVMEPQLAKADITDIPGARGGATNGVATSTGERSFAIGIGATTGTALDATAIGY